MDDHQNMVNENKSKKIISKAEFILSATIDSFMGYLMTRDETRKVREALVEFIRAQSPSHHITVTLKIGQKRPALEDALNRWVIRVNRSYLGRNWYAEKNRQNRMTGWVFFESGVMDDNPHAHLIVRSPLGSDHGDFAIRSKAIFEGNQNQDSGLKLAEPIACGGTMHVQIIDGEPDSVRRLVRYDTKELEFRPGSYGTAFKHIDDFCRRSSD
jgi:hypothetical protein